jgi:NADH dehydrogenase (ubiquinone) Fe-S protein 6
MAIKRSYAFSMNDKHELSDPAPPKNAPSVLKTIELPVETHTRDQSLQEYVDEAERFGMMQAPNRATIWSRSQNPRPKAMSGPRFEQTIIKHQVRMSSWAPIYLTTGGFNGSDRLQ